MSQQNNITIKRVFFFLSKPQCSIVFLCCYLILTLQCWMTLPASRCKKLILVWHSVFPDIPLQCMSSFLLDPLLKGEQPFALFIMTLRSYTYIFRKHKAEKNPQKIPTRNGGSVRKGTKKPPVFTIPRPLVHPKQERTKLKIKRNQAKNPKGKTTKPRIVHCLVQKVEAAMQLSLPCRWAQG